MRELAMGKYRWKQFHRTELLCGRLRGKGTCGMVRTQGESQQGRLEGTEKNKGRTGGWEEDTKLPRTGPHRLCCRGMEFSGIVLAVKGQNGETKEALAVLRK